MEFQKRLPPELEQRWEKIREQFDPLELNDSSKLIRIWKLDRQSFIALLVIIFAAMALTWIWWTAGKYQPVFEKAPIQTPVSSAPSLANLPKPTDEIFVHIYGEVLNPGVYNLPTGSRVFQVLELAGGQTSTRELTINLAQILQDGDQIFIGESAVINTQILKDKSVVNENVDLQCVNINLANTSELDTLPGIGPVMSQKIIEWRATNDGFKSLSDLKKVKGIGDAKYKEIEPLVCI